MSDDRPPIDEGTPLTLKDACEIVFKNQIKPATLRAEAARGKLVIERIGRRDFVTLAAIDVMREKCRVYPETSHRENEGGIRNSESSISSERKAAAGAAVRAAVRDLKARKKVR